MKSMYRIRKTREEVKADLLDKLYKYADICKSDSNDTNAAYMLDKVSDELVQHHGMTYDEINAIVYTR